MNSERKARLDKVRKLINLAASSNLQEAQMAAYRACALIREAGLDVVDPDEVDRVYAELSTAQTRVKQLEQSVPAEEDSGWSRFQVPLSATSSRTRPAAGPPPRRDPPMAAPVNINASRYNTKCKHCRKAINIGDALLWQKDVGAWCGTSSCYQDWLNGAKATAAFNPFDAPY